MGNLFVRPYSIVLCQYPALPLRDRLIAEDRFGSALENLLGGVTGVWAAFQATGMGDEPVLAGAVQDAALQRWARAAQSARLTGLRGLADVPGAYFELQMTEASPGNHRPEVTRPGKAERSDENAARAG